MSTPELTAGSEQPVVVACRPDAVVSIVTVTFGTDEIVLDALFRIACQTTVPYEVIVVDNAPADGRAPTRALLRQRTRGVRLITPDENLGFAGGNELGVEHARAPYVCFLNPDVCVSGDWLRPLLGALEDPAVAIAAPLLLHADGMVQEAGQLILGDGWTVPIGGPMLRTGDETQLFSRDVDHASGCCWLARRAEHVARGGFDRSYHPAYFEDADYAMRVQQSGQVVRLVVDQPVVHLWGRGGAGREGAASHASHDRFVARWRDQLAERPSWPDGEAHVIDLRDRACARRFVGVVSGASLEERQQHLQRAVHLAQRRPRDRVTLLVDDSHRLDVIGARRGGVEVIVGNVDGVIAERRYLYTDWSLDDPVRA